MASKSPESGWIERWPRFVIWTGLFLFWLACIGSALLPVEALAVGPILMLAGAVMTEGRRRGRP